MNSVRLHDLYSYQSPLEEVKEDLKSDVLRKSILLGKLYKGLLDLSGVSADSAVLIVSLDDGPLAAYQILKNIQNHELIDRVIPVYSKNSTIPSESILYGKLTELTKNENLRRNDTAALSAFYDDAKAEKLTNAVESLLPINNLRQCSMTVYLPVGKVPSFQKTIDFFTTDLKLDLGYFLDSSQSSFSSKDFISEMRNIDDSDEAGKAKRFINELLEDRNGNYSSPLRLTEVIRSVIIGTISLSKGNVSYLKLLKSLDVIYSDNRISSMMGVRTNAERNRISVTLINQMVENQVLLKERARERDWSLKKGAMWNASPNFIDPYLTYYNEIAR